MRLYVSLEEEALESRGLGVLRVTIVLATSSRLQMWDGKEVAEIAPHVYTPGATTSQLQL